MSEDNEEETPLGVRAPIVGYEVVDRREKFTVYLAICFCVSKQNGLKCGQFKISLCGF